MSVRNHHVTAEEITAIENITTPGEFPGGIPFEFGNWVVTNPMIREGLPCICHFCRSGNIVKIQSLSEPGGIAESFFGLPITAATGNLNSLGLAPFTPNRGTFSQIGHISCRGRNTRVIFRAPVLFSVTQGVNEINIRSIDPDSHGNQPPTLSNLNTNILDQIITSRVSEWPGIENKEYLLQMDFTYISRQPDGGSW